MRVGLDWTVMRFVGGCRLDCGVVCGLVWTGLWIGVDWTVMWVDVDWTVVLVGVDWTVM